MKNTGKPRPESEWDACPSCGTRYPSRQKERTCPVCRLPESERAGWVAHLDEMQRRAGLRLPLKGPIER